MFKKLAIAILILTILSYGFYWLFYDWSRFKQDLIEETTSPDGTYSIHFYVSNFGATSSHNLLGELIFNEGSRKSKKLYWEESQENVNVEWISDEVVIINNVELKLPNQIYDYREGIISD